LGRRGRTNRLFILLDFSNVTFESRDDMCVGANQ